MQIDCFAAGSVAGETTDRPPTPSACFYIIIVHRAIRWREIGSIVGYQSVRNRNGRSNEPVRMMIAASAVTLTANDALRHAAVLSRCNEIIVGLMQVRPGAI